jgi:hypothetical protein
MDQSFISLREAAWGLAGANKAETEMYIALLTAEAEDGRLFCMKSWTGPGGISYMRQPDEWRVLRTALKSWMEARGIPTAFGQREPSATTDPAPAKTQVADEPTLIGTTAWTLIRPQRFPGYRKPLYDLLKAASIAGSPCPKAHDVLDTWKLAKPHEIFQIMSSGVKYYDNKGALKVADLKAIQQTIKGLTTRLAQ